MQPRLRTTDLQPWLQLESPRELLQDQHTVPKIGLWLGPGTSTICIFSGDSVVQTGLPPTVSGKLPCVEYSLWTGPHTECITCI